MSYTPTTSINTSKLVGRNSPGVGAIEEITLGPSLSFTGNTLNVINQNSSIDPLTQFDYLVTKFSTPPSLNLIITNGKVFNYTLEGITRFRFVPTIYNPSLDAFYSTFTSGILTGLITKRG